MTPFIYYHLKHLGSQASNWQGGIRVNAFVAGGFLPAAARGTKLDGLAAAWDIYATFAHLAGVDPTDRSAAAAGLPAIDSINQWAYFSGATRMPPRKELPIGASSCTAEQARQRQCINQWGWGAPSDGVVTVVQGLIVDTRKYPTEPLDDSANGGLWKLLTGNTPMDGWTGPLYPVRCI